jgi:hypothetical protein
MTTAIAKDQPLPPDFWAVMCLIKQEPNYRFVRDEAKLAKRMADVGLLAPAGDKRYTITQHGQKCYDAEQLLGEAQ